MKVAANSCLCGMDIAEIVRSINDPEFFVASCIIQNLFVLLQDNQGRKTEFCSHRNNVLLGILHCPGAPWVCLGGCRLQPNEARGNQCKTESKNGLGLRHIFHTYSPEL